MRRIHKISVLHFCRFQKIYLKNNLCQFRYEVISVDMWTIFPCSCYPSQCMWNGESVFYALFEEVCQHLFCQFFISTFTSLSVENFSLPSASSGRWTDDSLKAPSWANAWVGSKHLWMSLKVALLCWLCGSGIVMQKAVFHQQSPPLVLNCPSQFF